MIDATREYQKSLLMAGPGELLKKLYVGSVAGQRAPSAGEFMSWDPESRQTYYNMRGGDAGAHNREEQFLLRGRSMTVAQEQAQAAGNRSAVNAWGNRIGGFTAAAVGNSSGMPLPNLDALDQQALKTATNLNLLGTGAAMAAAALGKLTDKLNAIANPNAPKKSFDLSSGHALGSMQPGL
jgi:hypothetical protein